MAATKTSFAHPTWSYGAPNSATIVMIHGFRGTHHGLDLIARELETRGYHVLVPDLPGFGEAKKLDTEHSLDAYVDWLRTYIAGLPLAQPPVLLGHSFGSIVTSAYAAKYPETITKLILENPIAAPALEGPRGALTKLAQAYYWIGKVAPERIAKPWLSTKISTMVMSITMAKTRDKATRTYIHQQHLAHFSTFADAQSLQEAFNTSVSHAVRDVAGQIPHKTLLIGAEKDDITSVAQQKELSTLFGNAQLHIISGVGHLTHYETPTAVADLVDDFVKSE